MKAEGCNAKGSEETRRRVNSFNAKDSFQYPLEGYAKAQRESNSNIIEFLCGLAPSALRIGPYSAIP